MTLMAVMIGGAVGAAIRYGFALALNPPMGTGMPWGTLAVNLIGCALIGWLATALSDASEPVRLGIIVGLLGGFTTFSSFGLESVRLLQGGHTAVAVAYVLISNAGGLLAAWLGMRATGG